MKIYWVVPYDWGSWVFNGTCNVMTALILILPVFFWQQLVHQFSAKVFLWSFFAIHFSLSLAMLATMYSSLVSSVCWSFEVFYQIVLSWVCTTLYNNWVAGWNGRCLLSYFQDTLLVLMYLMSVPWTEGCIAKLEATISSLVPLCGIESGFSLFSLWLCANLSWV